MEHSGLIRARIIRRFVDHVKELEDLGYLPNNWFWNKTELIKLDRIDMNLLTDLEDLYHTYMLDKDHYRQVKVMLETLHQRLKEDLARAQKGTIASDQQAREAGNVNHFLERLEGVLNTDKNDLLSASQFSYSEQIWHQIPFDRWINNRYREFQNNLKKLEAKGTLIEGAISFVKRDSSLHYPLHGSDLKSFQLITECAPLQYLRTHYGYPYIRPLLAMNLGDFQKLYRALFGRLGSSGFVAPVKDGLHIIISSGQEEFAYHELRHSIDPFMSKRIGRNNIIDEVIAFFGGILRPNIYTITTTYSDGTGKKTTKVEIKESFNTLMRIRYTLKLEMYYRQTKWRVGFEGYKLEVDRVMDKLDQLTKTHTLQQIDKMLFNTVTIDQIMSLH